MVANTQYTDYFMIFIGPASILLYLFYEMKNFLLAENKKVSLAVYHFSISFKVFSSKVAVC
jgi:POT family proton-dependent oligopeptide transporter